MVGRRRTLPSNLSALKTEQLSMFVLLIEIEMLLVIIISSDHHYFGIFVPFGTHPKSKFDKETGFTAQFFKK